MDSNEIIKDLKHEFNILFVISNVFVKLLNRNNTSTFGIVEK